MSSTEPTRFLLLVYRLPATPTAGRVAVWRMLRKLGGVSLQQSVSVFPRVPRLERDLEPVLARIDDSGGEYFLLPVAPLSAPEHEKLKRRFIEQTDRQYAEIIENCSVNFVKEIEFELFRGNLTYEEAEEIRSDYDKIVAWFDRVSARDWFSSPDRAQAEAWVKRCSTLLDDFEARVFRLQSGGTPLSAGSQRGRRQSRARE